MSGGITPPSGRNETETAKFTVSNDGSAATGALTATITVQGQEIIIFGVSGDGWNCEPTSTGATCTGTLAAGASVTPSVTFKIGFGGSRTCSGTADLTVSDSLGDSKGATAECS